MKSKIILLLAFIYLSCENQYKGDKQVYSLKSVSEKDSKKTNFETQDIEEFTSFIDRFKTDKKFRISVIKFPLNGFNSDEHEVGKQNENYLWDKKIFTIYSNEDIENEKNNKNVKNRIYINDSFYIYNIYIENSGYNVEYKFQKNNNKWNLVYYSYKNF